MVGFWGTAGSENLGAKAGAKAGAKRAQDRGLEGGSKKQHLSRIWRGTKKQAFLANKYFSCS